MGISQSFWKKHLHGNVILYLLVIDVNLYLLRFQGMKLEAIVVEEEMRR